MGDTTTYRVEADFVAKDNASGAIGDIAHHAEAAHHHTNELREALKEVGEALALRELVHVATESFIGFNSAIEQSKLKLSEVIGSNFQADWQQATAMAEKMHDHFQEIAEVTGVSATTMDNFAAKISASVTNTTQLMDITAQASAVSKAFYGDAERGAMELNRMLSGQVSNRSAMAKMLLNSTGLNAQQWKALSTEQRVKKTEGALNSDTMKNVVATMGNTFEGATSIFKDKVEVALAQVGLPLFHAITEEVQSWSKWMDLNHEKLEEIGRTVGDNLMSGFRAIKDVFAFIYDHADTLMAIGKVYAIAKIGSMAGGMLGAGAGDIAGLLGGGGKLGKAATGSSVMGNAGMIGMAGGVGFAFGKLLNETFHLTDAFSRSAEVHGEILDVTDSTTAKYADLVNSMDVFDNAVTEASKRLNKIAGGGGTQVAAGLTGTGETFLRQANVIRDVLKERTEVKNEGIAASIWGMLKDGATQGLSKAITEADQIKRLHDVGLTGDDIGTVMNSFAEAQKLAAANASRGQGDLDREKLISGTTDDVLKGLDKSILGNSDLLAKVTQNLSTFANRNFTDTHGDASLSKADIARAIKEAEDGEGKGLKKRDVAQTVNITINQVSAKDPDRWLADIDDMASRSHNAPRRAKSSLATKIGSGH